MKTDKKYKIVVPNELKTLAIIKAVDNLEKALNSGSQNNVVLPIGFEIVLESK